MKIHHVQLAIPRDGEDVAREFWIDIIGLSEIPKPESLRPRGGVWLIGGTAEVHLGVADPFVPTAKAHPGFVVDNLDELQERLEHAGYETHPDSDFREFRRFHVSDPFGNRVEFLAPARRSSVP